MPFLPKIQGCPTHNSIDVEDAPGPNLSLLVDPELIVCDDPLTCVGARSWCNLGLGRPSRRRVRRWMKVGFTWLKARWMAVSKLQSVDVLFQAKPVLQFFHEGNPISG